MKADALEQRVGGIVGERQHGVNSPCLTSSRGSGQTNALDDVAAPPVSGRADFPDTHLQLGAVESEFSAIDRDVTDDFARVCRPGYVVNRFTVGQSARAPIQMAS